MRHRMRALAAALALLGAMTVNAAERPAVAPAPDPVQPEAGGGKRHACYVRLPECRRPSFTTTTTTTGRELVRFQLIPVPLSEPTYAQRILLDASGGVDKPAPFRGQIVFRGDDAFRVKHYQDNLDAAQRNQHMRDYWRNLLDEAQLTKVGASFDEAIGALTWTAEGTLRMHWSDDGDYELKDMRLGDRTGFTLPAGTDPDPPYAVSFPDYHLYQTTLRLPHDYRFSISGEDINQTLAGTHYGRMARQEDDLITVLVSSRSLVGEVSADEAHAAESGLRELSTKPMFIRRDRRLPSVAELQSEAGKSLGSAQEYIDRGIHMTRRGMQEPAVAEFSSALSLEPDNALALSNRGIANFELEEYEEARTDLRKALSLDPEDPVALRGLGALARHDGRAGEAIDLLTRSLRVEENDWARERRADALLDSGDTRNAALDLFAIHSKDPTLTRITDRAYDLVDQHRLDDVRLLAQSALDDKVGLGNGAAVAAALYRISGDFGRALEVLTAATQETPTPELYVLRSTAEPTPDKTVASLEKALELDPQFEAALSGLSAVRAAMRDYPTALQLLDRLEAVSGPTVRVQKLRASILIRMDEADRARETYAAIRSLARTSPDFNDLCWEQATRNFALEDALEDCDTALKLLPDCAPCLDSRGFVLLRMGRYEDAVVAYDKAITAEPRNPASFYGRGMARIGLDREVEGEADIAAAMKMSPGVKVMFDMYGVER